MRRGLDYSGTPPSVGAMRAAGFDFAVRYVVPGRSVSLTAAEYRTLRAGGIDVAGVWERTADRALAGHDAGAHDMREAMDYVVAIGGPADAPLYMVVDDWGATAAQGPAIASYLAGAVSVRGHDRTGAYGGLRAIRYLADHNACRLYWQTYAWSGSSQARAGDVIDGTTAWDPRAQLRQKPNGQHLDGVEVDFNTAVVADFGQWGYQEADMTPEEFANAAVAGTLDPAFKRQAQILAAYGIARSVDVRAAVAPLLDDQAVISAAVADKASAVLGALAALPTGDLSEDERQALAADIAGQVPGLETSAVLDALAARLVS